MKVWKNPKKLWKYSPETRAVPQHFSFSQTSTRVSIIGISWKVILKLRNLSNSYCNFFSPKRIFHLLIFSSKCLFLCLHDHQRRLRTRLFHALLYLFTIIISACPNKDCRENKYNFLHIPLAYANNDFSDNSYSRPCAIMNWMLWQIRLLAFNLWFVICYRSRVFLSLLFLSQK